MLTAFIIFYAVAKTVILCLAIRAVAGRFSGTGVGNGQPAQVHAQGVTEQENPFRGGEVPARRVVPELLRTAEPQISLHHQG